MIVSVLIKIQTKTIEIGDYKNSIRQAFDNGPKIDAKFFPYLTKYKKTRFIKKITVYTDSQIDSAIVKMRLYSVDENGLPASVKNTNQPTGANIIATSMVLKI